LEHDITEAQRIGFKIFKKLKMEENDRLKLNLIPKVAWEKHYVGLWQTETTAEENTEGAEDGEVDENTEEISQEELETVTKENKEQKGPRNGQHTSVII
jgi:hypothetical protein